MNAGAMVSQDTQVDPTFGQILACFAVLPPLLQVAKMLPRLRLWFINLHWARLLTRRSPPRPLASIGRPVLQNLHIIPNYHVRPVDSEEGSCKVNGGLQVDSSSSLNLPYANTYLLKNINAK
ncbi:hypothetical protein M422DRAFT_44326 [Sphaerobolus stellatus SS14]|nr:hypothetical protein M422DRAFT_44326 [Sphaerobolus stellatus SS14]